MGRSFSTSLIVATTAGVVLLIGVAVAGAGAPAPDYRGHAIGTIRSIDRADNVVTMSDGLRLRAGDGQMLDDLREGDLVKVDFAHERGGWVIRAIEGAYAEGDPAGKGGGGGGARKGAPTMSGLPGPQLRRVTEFINDTLARALPLAELSAEAHLSQFPFARLLKESRGLPPHRFVV